MTNITRRSAFGGIALLARAAPGRVEERLRDLDPGNVFAHAQATPADLERSHIEAYKAAAQATDPTIKSWWRVVPEDDSDIAFWIIAQR
ncbi:MAG TPA: hypothetical protein VHC00_15715 [Rhizobiaceae bacterium]|nr:hypothetical protein [Rhizobiaceae bacterium]